MLARVQFWPRRHPLLIDSVCAVALLFVSLPFHDRIPGSERWALEVALAIGMTLPLALRRRHPIGVFVVVVGVAFVQWLTGVSLRPEDVAILIASYTVAAHGRRWEAIVATGVVLAGVAMAIGRWRFEDQIPAFVALSAVAVAALVLGDDLRNRRAYLAGLEERAARLEHEQEAETRAAIAAERANIARELHDIVAHNLSVMVIQADAATYAITDDAPTARRAMDSVAATGRQALDEMRHMLGVLRSDHGDGLVPQPSLDQLDELLDGVRRAGLATSLHITGRRRPLAAGVELTAYRIVQEALTNTLKHTAAATSADITVSFEPERLRVLVRDNGRATQPTSLSGSGRGLVGMHERVAAFGGEVSAGPRPGGGFVVVAELPIGRSTSMAGRVGADAR